MSLRGGQAGPLWHMAARSPCNVEYQLAFSTVTCFQLVSNEKSAHFVPNAKLDYFVVYIPGHGQQHVLL